MKSFIERLRKFSFLSLPLCFCSLFFLDFSFRYFYKFAGDTSLLAKTPTVFSVGWCLLITALISLLPRLGKKIAMIFSISLYTVLTLVHGVLFGLTGKMFSFADMNFAGDGAKFFSWSYFNLRKAFFLCIIFAVLLMVAAVILIPKEKGKLKLWQRLSASIGAVAVAVVMLVINHNACMPKAETLWWGSTYNSSAADVVYNEFTDSNRCLTMTGLYQYTYRNFLVSFGLTGDRMSADRLDDYYDERAEKISGDNEMTGALEGKNLIMVMLESIDTWLLTPEYMPNLYDVQQQSINFTDFYTPTYLSAGTFTTEIISQTGLIPAVSGLSSSAYSVNSFPLSLANQFANEGYNVNSFHSASPSIYSRGSVHTNLGFAAYHSYTDMGMDDYQLDSQLINGYDLMTDGDKFFSYIITYSGHGPYTEEMANISDPHYETAKAAVAKSGVTGSAENMEEYTIAVAHAMETDEFIGELIAQLEEDGLLENTAVLFYADHYGKYMTDREFLYQIKGVADDGVSIYHTPCFIYGGGLAAQQIDKPASSADIVPTIVNLYGLAADRKYYIGDDIFGDCGGVVPLPNYGWYDGETVYLGGETTTEDAARKSEDIKERMTASADTLKCNYFKNTAN